jgi:hypothetical protein
MTSRHIFTSLIAFGFLSFNAHAAIQVSVRTPADLKQINGATAAEATLARVVTARVALADYPLIAHDFPKMQQRSGESLEAWHQRVDQWLIQETAFINVGQLTDNGVNTFITTTAERKTAYRPKGYNRAHVIPVDGGLIDVKGDGTASPSQRDHSNGLATLGEMIREYVYEKLETLIFKQSKTGINTVGCYGVVDFGFNIVHADGSQSRAGYVLRQAHNRATAFNSSLPRDVGTKIELLLRKYGLTSSGETFGFRSAKRDNPWDYTNIQGTDSYEKNKTIEVIDFGAHLAIRGAFEFDLRAADAITVVVPANSQEFVQPDPKLRVPTETWASSGPEDSKADRPWVYAHETAAAFAEGRADRSAVERHVETMLQGVREKFAQATSCEDQLISPIGSL